MILPVPTAVAIAVVLSLLSTRSYAAPPMADQPQLWDAAVAAIDASVAKTLAQGSPGMTVAVAYQGRPLS